MEDEITKDNELDEKVLKRINDMWDMLEKRLTAIEDMIDSVRAKDDIIESDNTAERDKGDKGKEKRLKFRDGKYIEE